MLKIFSKEIYSKSARLSRLQYAIRAVIILVLLYLDCFILMNTTWIGADFMSPGDVPAWLVFPLLFLVLLPALIFLPVLLVVSTMKRLRDLNLSVYWVLAYSVLILESMLKIVPWGQWQIVGQVFVFSLVVGVHLFLMLAPGKAVTSDTPNA
jgi:uncharacterized membrane protein YhaH (DUF805 family)